MSSPVKKNKRGQVIHSGQRQVILRLYKNLKDENPECRIKDILQKVAISAGISARSVFSIVKEKKETGTLKSPAKRKPKTKTIFNNMDDFLKTAIRKKVHELFFKNELPTLNKVLHLVNTDEQLGLPNLRRTTLFHILKKLNFRYEKRNRKSILLDKEDIILWRRDYLRKIKAYREEGRTIYYLDETWVNAGHTKSKVWTDKSVCSSKDAFLRGLSAGLKCPTGKGKRLIVTHIGSQKGFVEDGLLIFESKSDTDYHSEMNGENFKEWFSAIIQKLDNNCVIVMDNAPYHSVQVERLPTTRWNKQQIRNWLTDKGIFSDESMLKVELLKLVSYHRPNYKKYVIDEIAKETNRIVLRTPPYHCELNPIEMVWAEVKGYVASNNVTFNIKEVHRLLTEGVSRVTPDKWEKYVKHVVDVEESNMWKLDNIIEDIEPFVIAVDDSSSSSSESDFADPLNMK